MTLSSIIKDSKSLSHALIRVKAARETASLLRKMRKNSGLTQSEIAELLNVSQARVSQIESGKLENLASIDTVYVYAEVCGFSISFQELIREYSPFEIATAGIKASSGVLPASDSASHGRDVGEAEIARKVDFYESRSYSLKMQKMDGGRPSAPNVKGRFPTEGGLLAAAAEVLVRMGVARMSKSVAVGTPGTVKFYNGTKGFGFISPDDGGSDVFVHVTALERAGLSSLAVGQKIFFEVSKDSRTGKSVVSNLHSVKAS